MAARLADGKYIIMTGAAVIHDSAMIKRCRQEYSGNVAHMAVIAGWHMIRRRRFARSGGAIVARRTVINDTRMIEPGTGKSGRIMAHRAILRGQDVADTLLGYRRRSIVAMA